MGGETIGRLVYPGWGLDPPFSWNLPPHGCRDAESWVVLFDFNSLPLKVLQLGLCPNYLGREMTLVCRDSSPVGRRYCACNTVASSNCRVFFMVGWPLALFWLGTWRQRPIISYIKKILAIRGIVVFSATSASRRHVKSYDQSKKKCGNRYIFVTKRVAT